MSAFIDLFNEIITPSNMFFLMDGLSLSLKFAFGVIIGSIILGAIIALARCYGPKFIQNICVFYVEVFRNTPMLLWILFARFSLSGLLHITGFQSVTLIFILFCASGVSETIRGGLSAISKGQFEAAQSQGFTFYKTLWYIVIPQTVKIIAPQLLQTVISIIKDSSFLSTIGIADLMYQGRVVMAHYFQPAQIIFIFGYIAGLYFIINFSLSLVVRYLTSNKRDQRRRNRQLKMAKV